jgi:hypothetical protein
VCIGNCQCFFNRINTLFYIFAYYSNFTSSNLLIYPVLSTLILWSEVFSGSSAVWYYYGLVLLFFV